jgi:hypothetical protein
MAEETRRIEWDLDCKKGTASLLFELNAQRLEIVLMSTDDPANPLKGIKGEVDEETCHFVNDLLKDALRRRFVPFQIQIPVVVGFRVFPASNSGPERSIYASEIKHIELVFQSVGDISFVHDTLTQLEATLKGRRLASRIRRT